MKIKSQEAFRWTAREGFIGALALILSSLALNQMLRIGYETSPGFANWVRTNSYLAELTFMFLRLWLWLFVTWLCSRSQSIYGFVHSAGFGLRPTLSGWLLALVVAVPTGFLDLLLAKRSWIHQNAPAVAYEKTNQVIWWFFIVYTVIMSPFVEEILMRGFLYRAFRGSFGIVSSIAAIVGIQTYFHWGLVTNDLVALLSLTMGGVVLCIVRERTASTWNCVLFHSVYNAVVMRQWLLCFIELVAFLGCCTRRQKPETQF